MSVTDSIPVGHDNARTLEELESITGIGSRLIRTQIAASDELIINLQDGCGYFKPDRTEGLLVKEWIALMNSRATEIIKRLDQAKEWEEKNV